MTGLERWANFYHRSFYLPAIYILCVIAALISGFIFHRKSKLGKLFLLYLFIDLIIYALDDYYRNFYRLTRASMDVFSTSTNVLVCLVELLVYLSYFQKISRHKKLKKLYSFFKLLLFLLVFIYGLMLIPQFKFSSTTKITEYIAATEFLMLLIPSFVYYIDLFLKDTEEALFTRPSFWITTGIFLFIILSIPYYSINYYLLSNKYSHYNEITAVFFYVPLILNYFLLTKAFLCRRPLTT